MIGYLNNTHISELESYPLCIIGAGAAGISLAVHLSRLGHRILLIEGGDWNEGSEVLDAYMGKATPPHPQTTEFRYQRFGGTTHLWGGRCVPLDSHDFEKRAHVPESGWPEGAKDIANYYAQALDYCDAGDNNFNISAFGPNTKPIFSEAPTLAPDLNEYIERYSLPTDFGKKFRQELENSVNVKVLLRARCTKLNTSAQNGDVVETITLHDGQQSVDVKVNQIVLAGGGIDTTRLLLVSRQYQPAWSHLDGSLGKYYACHYDLIYGALRFKNERPIFDFQKTTEGVYARRKLQFSAEFQTKHGLLNSAFRLHFPAYADPSHGSGILSTIYLAKSILKPEYQTILNHGGNQSLERVDYAKHVWNVVSDPVSVIRFAYDWLFKIKLAKRRIPYTLVANRNGTYPIEFNSEQVSDAVNRIELLDEYDRYGMPRVSVHWKMTAKDIASGIKSFNLLQQQFENTNACRLEFDQKELEKAMESALPVGGHHMGTTRMGTAPNDSVVDVNCKVHGVKNLYIASASVFTTNSHANPTLTIVALALRLADHLNHIQALRSK
ncbi:GMC family oxidoreductase [Methylophilus sp. VKM B-3414]|uniref:GMC family oxidoreductase n=1 Tax=Methylophilus sp. VKM B-3414 TaxID=3076121 RepID=UPI0028C5CEA7|nr:GMC family oxidoreductase [Methylophilus sp. VKM B-3414]MDT7850702.1 GMC family oxidoreductase [Methylophilus sp. VKM B-3414]